MDINEINKLIADEYIVLHELLEKKKEFKSKLKESEKKLRELTKKRKELL